MSILHSFLFIRLAFFVCFLVVPFSVQSEDWSQWRGVERDGNWDVTGIIDNNKKFTNFKFETNIFLDNLKRFYNKFGIYNKEKNSSHLFVSGNLNLVKLKLLLNEISSDNEFEQEDISYIQKEFNKIVLENGYTSLFQFTKLKEFINLITN